jgi:hypothetical protein
MHDDKCFILNANVPLISHAKGKEPGKNKVLGR